MVTSMRALGATNFATTALRTIAAIDSAATAVDSSAFKAASAKQQCLGAGILYVMAGHDNASGTMDVRACFYDANDDLIAISASATMAATALKGTLTEDDGSTTNVRQLSQSSLVVPAGSYAARIFVAALTTSTAVDLFIGTDDPYTR